MAATTARVSTASTTNASSYASGSFTPAANELLIAICHYTATTATSTPTMTDSQSLGMTRVGVQVADNSGSALAIFVSNALAAASSMTVTLSAASSTGAIIQVCGVSGMTKTGATAIYQSMFVDKAGAGGNSTTPFATFNSVTQNANPVIGGVLVVGTNPATITPPSGFTEQNDTGYNTPATGGEYANLDSGFVATTVTWGSTVAGRWQTGIIELDTSGTTSPDIYQAPYIPAGYVW